jgi:hypothetical protein
MPVTINGTTGVVTPGATIGSINGILKSSSGVVSQASVGTDYSQLTLATAQTASGTAVDFTSIPSWVKRITVMFNGVSTSGTSNIQIQIGAGSVTSSGYTSSIVGGVAGNVLSGATGTTGFLCVQSLANSYLNNGHAIITSAGSNIWVMASSITTSTLASGVIGGGTITLSGTLDRIRITTGNGTDTFDAGTINISYE